jgi:DNA-damage-inducible protein J
MTQNAVVRARIDQKTKQKAEVALEAMGLTVSDAFRLMMKRIANDGALPFSPLVPNAETIEAMLAADRGEVTGSYSSVEQMLTALEGDDSDA